MTEWPPKDFAKRARDGTWTHESTIDAAQDEIEFLHARIARLQSALATARREGIEAAEKVALSSIRFGELRDNAVCDRIARDIRALLSQSVEVGRALTSADTEKLERNARVQARWDELWREGKHGHYETLFRVVREEVERGRLSAGRDE